MDTLDEILAHHGVKGMKWGVRRAEKKWGKKAGSVSTFIKIHNAAADEMNRVHVSRINNDPRYKNVDFTKPKNKALNDRYMNDYAKTWNSVLAKHSQAIAGTSPTGRRFVLSQDPHTGNFTGHVIEKANAQHAVGEPTVIFVTDDTGHVTEVKIDTMAQTAMLGEEALEHFGIKGMKWGVRRREGSDGTVSGHLNSPHGGPSHDAARAAELKTRASKGGTSTLSNQELKALTERMNLEQQYSRLTGDASNVAKARKGFSAVREILNVGKTASEAYNLVNSPMAKEIGKALAK